MDAVGLTKKISDVFTLSDISIRLRSGKACVVFGENGAGKTTLVRILAGEITPDSGQIRLSGKIVNIDSPSTARSLGISVSHQNSPVFRHMNVVTNMRLLQNPSQASLFTNRTTAANAQSLLDELGLLGDVTLDQQVSTLSAGQRRQLEIASVISRDCPVLILDDPTAHLSDEKAANVYKIVGEAKQRGVAVLYTCHRIEEAKSVADAVIVLRNGKVTARIEDGARITSEKILMGMMGVLFDVRAEPGLPIEKVSRNVEIEFGYTPQSLEAESRPFREIVHPDDLARFENIQPSMFQNGSLEREYRILCSDGSHKWIHDLVTITGDPNGIVRSYRIGVLDVEAAEQAQEALRHSEEKYAALVNNIPDVVYSSLPNSVDKRSFASHRWEDWTGQSFQSLSRGLISWLDMLDQSDKTKVRKAYEAASTAGTEYLAEYGIKHITSGQIRYLRDHALPLKDQSGNVSRFDGVLTDVTEIRRLEQQLRQTSDFLSRVLSTAPIPILLFSADGSVTYVNPATESLTGFTSQEVLGSKFPYPWSVCEDGTWKPHGPPPTEECIRTRTGDQLWIQIRSAPWQREGPGAPSQLEAWHDITKEKHYAQNLRAYASLLTSAQEHERKRIARELHDEAIQLLFGLCTDIGEFLNDKDFSVRSHVKIEAVLIRLGDVMESLRSFCHQIRPDIIDRLGLVPAIHRLTDEIKADTCAELASIVKGPVRRLPIDTELALFRIAQEAMNNTRRHANASEITLLLDFEDDLTTMSIRDNGIGFDVSGSVDHLASSGKLGLVGMYERAHLVGGTLTIRSQRGKGTTVTVRVPNQIS